MNKTLTENRFMIYASSFFTPPFFTALFLATLYFIFLNPYLDVRGFNADDPVSYLSKGLSLWRGIGYGEQFANVFMPVTAQPLFFSLMLAPIVGIFGINFVAFKLFMVFLALLLGFATYRFFTYFLRDDQLAFLLTLILMSSPIIFGLSHRVLAEVPLYLFAVLALLTLDRYLRENSPVFSSGLWISSLLLGVSYLTKQTSISIWFGGWFLILFPQFRKKIVLIKLIVYTMVGFVPIAIWHGWASTVPDDLWYWTTPSARDFFDQNPLNPTGGLISLSDFLIRMRHNVVWGIANNSAMVLFAPFYFTEGRLLGFVLSVPIVVWFAWQWVKSFRKHPSVLEGFVFSGLSLLLMKYGGFAARYSALMYPAFLVYAARGIEVFRSKIRILILSSIIFVSMSTTILIALDQARNPYGSKVLNDYIAVGEQAKKLFPKDSKCAVPLLTHWQILTGHQSFYDRKTKVENLSGDLAYVVGLSDKAPQDLRLFKDLDRHVLSDAQIIRNSVNRQPEVFEKIYENQTYAIFKVVHHD